MLRKMRWRMMMLWKMRWRMMMLSMMMSRGGRWWCWEWWCWGGAVEMHLEISQEPLYTEIYAKNTATSGWAQNADTHTLCEPAQSKCTSTFHKRHFIQKIYCATKPQRRLWRACAVKMHINMSQSYFLQEKGRGPEPQPTLCASLRSRNALQHVTRAHFIRKFTENLLRHRTAAQTSCEPARWKCTSTCHKSHSYGNLQEKWLSPESWPTLCASLPSPNAHQHVTRATLYGNLQEKCRAPAGETWSIGLTTTVRTSQCGHTVWGNIDEEISQKSYEKSWSHTILWISIDIDRDVVKATNPKNLRNPWKKGAGTPSAHLFHKTM